MNIDEFGVTQDTLDELAATKPKWTNLKSFTVLNTDVDLGKNIQPENLNFWYNLSLGKKV